MNANGPICTHGYFARYVDSGASDGGNEGESSNAFVERTSIVASPSRILRSRRI